MMPTRRLLLAAALAATILAPAARAEDPFITLASTTSTEQSGLFPTCCRYSSRQTGIEVRVVAVGTGQALDIGHSGDADALLVHDKEGELKFVAERRRDRPPRRHVQRLRDRRAEVRPGRRQRHEGRRGRLPQDRRAKAPFASRGDDSGTTARSCALEGRRHRPAPGRRQLVPRARPGHGADAQHLRRDERLHAHRPGDLGPLQEPAGPRDPGRGRPQALQPVRLDPGEPGQVPARQGRAGQPLARVADLEAPARTRSPGYQIDGQQVFFPNARKEGS